MPFRGSGAAVSDESGGSAGSPDAASPDLPYEGISCEVLQDKCLQSPGPGSSPVSPTLASGWPEVTFGLALHCEVVRR